MTQLLCHTGGRLTSATHTQRAHPTHDMSNGDETVMVDMTAEAEKIMDAVEALRLGLGISKVEGAKLVGKAVL